MNLTACRSLFWGNATWAESIGQALKCGNVEMYGNQGYKTDTGPPGALEFPPVPKLFRTQTALSEILSKPSLVVAILCVMTASVTNWQSGLLGLGTYLSTAGPHRWDSISTSCREWDADRQTTWYKTNCAAQSTSSPQVSQRRLRSVVRWSGSRKMVA